MKIRVGKELRKGLTSLFILGVALMICLGTAQSQVLVSGRSPDWNYIARLPKDEAIAIAYAPEYSQYRLGILNLVFRIWSEEDPVAAHYRLLTLLNDFDKSIIETQIIERWMAVDSRSAMAAAADSENRQTFEMALRLYAHRDPAAALTLAQDYGARVGKVEWTGIIEGVASTNPRLAAQYVASLGHDGDYLIDAFIYALSRESPANAIDYLLESFPQQTRHYDSIASIFYIRNPVKAFEYLEQMENSAAKKAFAEGLQQAKSVNEASRATSRPD